MHYYFSDHLGSASVVTSADGSVIEQESDYYAFGGERAIVSGPNVYKFTGKERDGETGNDYFGARYFGSPMGRWLTPDWSGTAVPVPYALFTDPQSLNLYSYVRDNPVAKADLDGHCPDGMDVCFMPQLAQDPNYMAGYQKGAEIGLASVGTIAVLAGLPEATAAAGPLVRNLVGLAMATAPKTMPIVVDAIGGLAPGPPGSLTITAETRLRPQEISTGVRLAEQTGKSLVQSEHEGAEFVDAAGKTYDAMGGRKAYEHFGDGADFLKSIVNHLNKSVDTVAIDLQGASKSQIQTIKKFVGILSTAEQKKIIYVK